MSQIYKPRVYVETTIWNFVFADDSPERRDVTKEFFDEVRADSFDVYIAKPVLDEINAAREPRRSQLLGLIDDIKPSVLQSSDETLALAADLVAARVIPEKYATDALHIAFAVVENMDVLLSWNFKHIVKSNTRRLVKATSLVAGYKEIEIATPEEVINEDE